jgi:hypothetical protein
MTSEVNGTDVNLPPRKIRVIQVPHATQTEMTKKSRSVLFFNIFNESNTSNFIEKKTESVAKI